MSIVRLFVATLLLLALAPAPAQSASRICTSADTLTFGQRAVGSATVLQVTVSNCGDAAFAFTDVSRHTATNSAFRIDAQCATGMMLAPGAACTIDVWFEPQVPGQASGGVWLHNTTSTPDQLVTFYARAIDAQAGTALLEFSPAVADFGTQPLGQETAALVVTLSNRGVSPLVPSALVLNGIDPYDFRGESSATDCGIGRAIAAAGACTLHLYFKPLAAGPRQATLVVDAPQLAALAFLTLVGDAVAAPIVAPTIDVVEFHNSRDGQYFITADAGEIALLDAGGLGPEWSRTGMAFRAWPLDTPQALAVPVCRFFGTPGFGPNSHFYTAYASECAIVRTDAHWIEEGATFRARVPAAGVCGAGDVTVERLWFAGDRVTASRHRYVTDPATADEMRAAGWVLEGPVFCAPG